MKLAIHPASDQPMFAGAEINKFAFYQGIDKAEDYRSCHTGNTVHGPCILQLDVLSYVGLLFSVEEEDPEIKINLF
jgi:hypothetical protein